MKQKSFTLIELLVVVAIIAVLVAVLLPAIAKARAIAKQTMCLSNMKQLGVATQYYLQDNTDSFPVYGSYGGVVYLFQKYLPRPDMTSAYNDVFSYSMVWSCPNHPTDNPYGRSPAYGVNAAFAWNGVFWGSTKWVKMGNLPDPSHILWMTEGTYYTGPVDSYLGTWTCDRTDYNGQSSRWLQECFPRYAATCRWVSYRHDMHANIGFADGHAQTMFFVDVESYDGWQWK